MAPTGITRTLLDELPDGVLLIHAAELTILDVNGTFCRMSGWARHQMLGRPAADFVHPDDRQATPRDPGRALSGHTSSDERRYRRVDGSFVWCETRTRATESGYLVLVRDIRPVVRDRERLTTLTRLAQLRTKLAGALVEHDLALPVVLERAAVALAATIGDVCVIALVDRERDLLVPAAFSHRDPLGMEALKATLTLHPTPLGVGIAGKVAVDGVPTRVTDLPQDQLRSSVSPQYRSYVDQFPISSMVIVPLRGQKEVLGAMGLGRGPAYTNDDEQIMSDLAHLVALAIEDARHDAQLKRAMFLLQTATNSMPARVSYWNAHQRNEFANEAYREWLGLGPEEIEGRHLKDVIGEELYEFALPYIQRVLEGQRQDFNIKLADVSGQEHDYQVAYVPDHRPDGRVVGFVVLATDVTQLTLTAAQFEHQALHDPLTGLANRRALVDHIDLALKEVERAGCSVAVFYLDLDNFKQINDRHGHRAGDQLLIATAHRIGRIIRQGDTAARVGGDEFVILCKVRDRSVADDIGARLQHALSNSVDIDHGSITTSASLGVAFVETPGSVSAEQLLAAADNDMFSNKYGGNRQAAQR